MEILILLFWLAFAVAVGVLASNRGRSGFGWFVLAVLFSPLLAGLFVLVSRNLATAKAEPTAATHMRCPACREWIQQGATVCRFCGTAVNAEAAAAMVSAGQGAEEGYKLCRQCQAPLKMSATFCTKCGQACGSTATPPAGSAP